MLLDVFFMSPLIFFGEQAGFLVQFIIGCDVPHYFQSSCALILWHDFTDGI